MKLCYISDPNSTHTRRWVGWFAKHGHEVCLLADIPLKEAWPEVEVIDLSKFFYARVIRFPIWVVWVKRFLHHWQPDILHAHRVNSAGWLAAASGYHPLVITPWGSDVFLQPQRSKLERFLASNTLQRAELITANSQAMSERVVQLGARREAVSRVQFGVETDIFYPLPSGKRERENLRQRFSLPQDIPLVLSARAIRPNYNIDIILQSIPHVRKSFPTAIFCFINYNADPAYKLKLEAMTRELDLESNIRWLPPTHSRAEMADLYRMSDLVISVPSSDATPVSVLEAMACGKPVVCSDLLPVHEFMTSGESGWLVTVGQSLPLAEAVINLLAQPELAEGLGHKASIVVAERYNYELEMQKMEDLYEKLAASND